MNVLPCGERIVRCLTGGDIDRVPFGVNLGWHPWHATRIRWQAETGRSDLNVALEFGYDAGFAFPEMEYGIFPRFEREVIEDAPEHVILRDERGITMKHLKEGGSIPQFLEYPVKCPSDWDRLKNERLRLDDLDARITQDWPALRARLAGTGESVQVGAYPWGVFGTPRDLIGVEELLVDFYAEPDMIRDMMNHLTSLWLALWERVAAEARIDHIHIWEDMSGKQGSLISPAMVESFMMPCYDRIAEFARSHGVRLVSVDTDGDCSELVSIMTKHGVNVFFPFEVQAGNDILAYRKSFPELGIMCGLDKRCLARSLDEVEVEVERCRAMVGSGRYIPGFDHLIPPDAKWELFRHAASRIRDICHGARY